MCNWIQIWFSGERRGQRKEGLCRFHRIWGEPRVKSRLHWWDRLQTWETAIASSFTNFNFKGTQLSSGTGIPEIEEDNEIATFIEDLGTKAKALLASTAAFVKSKPRKIGEIS